MDFYYILEEVEEGHAYNPYAGRTKEGEWIEGYVSIDFLNEHFSQYETADEMIDATNSEGLKLYFAWLRDEKGLLR